MEEFFFHPRLVHIPIALAMLMPLISSALLVAWWRGWLPERAWFVAVALQAILFVSGIVAMQSGEAEEDRVKEFVAGDLIEEHEEAAEVFVWSSAGVLGLMLLAGAFRARRAGLPLAGAAAFGSFVVLSLGYRTGQAGGSLVYEHGAAEAYVTPKAVTASDTPRRRPKRDDD